MNNEKCILLVRVSTDAQDLSQQTEKVKAEAVKDGYTNIIVLEDKESAVKLSEEERNGLNMLKYHIKHDDIKCVYTYELSRISRQAGILYSIRDFLIEHHVQLIVLNPYMKMLKDDGTLDEAANIYFGLFSSLAENEGFLRKARCKRGREKKRKSLEHEGGHIPIGYALDKNHHYIIDEDKAKIIRRIFEDYVTGKSVRAIAEDLKNEGFANHLNNSLFCKIHIIIHREYYAGDWKHPAIISKELFDAAQKKCDDKRIYYGAGRTAILKGLLREKESGYIMSGKFATNQYVCKYGGKTACKMDIIDNIVGGVAREWHNIMFNVKREQYVRMTQSRIEQQRNIMRQQEKNITANQDKIDRITEMYIDGKLRKEKAEAKQEQTFKELQKYKTLYEHAKLEIERMTKELAENKKLLTDTRDIVVDVIKSIYLERIASRAIRIDIENKYTGEIRTIDFHSGNGKILDMKVQTRPTLEYKK